MRKAPGVHILPVLILTAVSVLSAFWLFYSYGSLRAYTTPYRVDPLPAWRSDPLTDRVVVVLIHGITLEASRRMETLNILRPTGADYMLSSVEPALCAATLASALTGTEPELAGVVWELRKGKFSADTIMDAAQRVGLVTGAVGSGDLGLLLGDTARHGRYYPVEEVSLDESVINDAIGILVRDKPQLLIVELEEPEVAGVKSGTTGADYLDACWQADARIARLLGSMDLSRETLIVTSLHGLTRDGGFGGDEGVVKNVPLIMAGRGILPVEGGKARLIDLAPTIAALLGCPVPSLSLGGMISRALALEAYAASEKAIRQAQVRANLVDSYKKGGSPPEGEVDYRVPQALREAILAHNTGDYDEATRRALEYDSRCLEEMRKVRGARILVERERRSIFGVLFILAIAFPVAVFWAKGDLSFGAFGAGIYFLTSILGFFQGPPRYSLSFVMENGGWQAFAMRFLVMVIAAFMLSSIATLAAGREVDYPRRQGRDYLSLLIAAWYLSFFCLTARSVAFWVWYGVGWHGVLPPMRPLLRFLGDLAQILVIGVLGLFVTGLWSALSFGVLRLSTLRRPLSRSERGTASS